MMKHHKFQLAHLSTLVTLADAILACSLQVGSEPLLPAGDHIVPDQESSGQWTERATAYVWGDHV